MNTPYHHGNLREVLLDHAVKTLSEKGVEQLSLRALAREVGVSHAAPLRHFRTKVELLNAIAFDGVQRLIASSQKVSQLAPGLERLRAMMGAYVTWAQTHPAYHQVLRNPDVMRHAPDDLTALLVEFAERQKAEIAIAQENGWQQGVDPDVLFIHLVSLTAGTAIVATDQMYDAPMNAAASQSVIQASMDLFLRA